MRFCILFFLNKWCIYFRTTHRAFFYTNSVTTFIYIFSPIYFCLQGQFRLPAKVWYPYNENDSNLFWLSYVQIVILLYYGAYLQFSIELIFIGLLIQVRTQLELLNHRVRQFVKNKTLSRHRNLIGPDVEKVEIILLKELIRDQRDIYR